jgi:hypothetical protein
MNIYRNRVFYLNSIQVFILVLFVQCAAFKVEQKELVVVEVTVYYDSSSLIKNEVTIYTSDGRTLSRISTNRNFDFRLPCDSSYLVEVYRPGYLLERIKLKADCSKKKYLLNFNLERNDIAN